MRGPKNIGKTGKELQASQMLVPDQKRGSQDVNIFFCWTRYDNILTVKVVNFVFRVREGACKLSHRVVEASGPLTKLL